jgi:hypothetical protein
MTDSNANETVARSLTDERLASDLDRIAADVRWITGEERATRLREAARRLATKTILPAEQVLVTLIDGRQVGIIHGNVQIRSSMSGTWSLPIEHATKAHQPGTYYLGEW